MGTHIMKFNIARQHLIKEVQEEFNRAYPFLRIEFIKSNGKTRLISATLNASVNASIAVVSPAVAERDEEADAVHAAARTLLWEEFGLSDGMKVSELEILLQYQFGLPAQVLRKSGNLWMETRMTQHWTLRQQNDHGKDLA